MSEELDRVHLAYDMAMEGRKVALISSGDICVYGMAGPAMEVLTERGWAGSDDPHVEVEVVPGISAVNAIASLVGAPLTHDYCTISLSDLLTPWPVIERRVVAAAQGDFVIALYNPQSKRRTSAQDRRAARAWSRPQDSDGHCQERLPSTPGGATRWMICAITRLEC